MVRQTNLFECIFYDVDLDAGYSYLNHVSNKGKPFVWCVSFISLSHTVYKEYNINDIVCTAILALIQPTHKIKKLSKKMMI